MKLIILLNILYTNRLSKTIPPRHYYIGDWIKITDVSNFESLFEKENQCDFTFFLLPNKYVITKLGLKNKIKFIV